MAEEVGDDGAPCADVLRVPVAGEDLEQELPLTRVGVRGELLVSGHTGRRVDVLCVVVGNYEIGEVLVVEFCE